MKKVMRLLMVLSLAGPGVINMSCSNVFWRQMRDAAFAGAANVVTSQTTTALNDAVNPGV